MKTVLAGLCLATGLAVLPMTAASAANIGDVQECVSLRDIKSSPSIDDNTILIKMRGSQYKRIDMATTCSGLAFSGFAQVSHDDKLCRSTVLRVLRAGGQACAIDKIVNIDEAEAKSLENKR